MPHPVGLAAALLCIHLQSLGWSPWSASRTSLQRSPPSCSSAQTLLFTPVSQLSCPGEQALPLASELSSALSCLPLCPSLSFRHAHRPSPATGLPTPPAVTHHFLSCCPRGLFTSRLKCSIIDLVFSHLFKDLTPSRLWTSNGHYGPDLLFCFTEVDVLLLCYSRASAQ